ncbi:MAG: hypothetical protein NPINA01_19740 [Nitrospinaceae bacterium]|nr:MAG: hypothetical protein NPINA01_19740 [Nitrospinaceae bacterium]
MTLVVLYATAIRFLSLLYPEEDRTRFSGPAMLSAGLLAFSGPFWFHSLVAEVYTLHSFFISLVLLLLLLWREKDDVRYLYSAALVYGLSSGNHATMAFLLPAILLLYFCWARVDVGRHLVATVLFFLIGLSVYGYLPLRSLAEPSMDWGNPETLKGFLYHVTDRKDAATHFSHFRDAGAGSDSVSLWMSATFVFSKVWRVVYNFLSDVWINLTPITAIGFLAGAAFCWKRNRRFFWFAFLIVAVNIAFFVNWRGESYFPSYIIAGLFTAVALFAVFIKGRESGDGKGENDSVTIAPAIDWRRLAFIGMACVIPFNAVSNYQKADRSGLYFGETLLKRMSLSLEDRSLFLTGMSWFNFYYHNDVMRLRDDVTAIRAWDFMDPDVPSLLTPRRYPDLNLPEPAEHRFDSRAESLKYIRDLFQRNETHRPILMDQNLTFFEQFPLEEDFEPYRNLLLKYRGNFSRGIGEPVPAEVFKEFKDWMEEELRKPGIFQTQWIVKVSFYIPSFAEHYHQTGRYEDEREILKLMRDFLGQQGADWWFKQIESLRLDGKIKRAWEELAIMKKKFPNQFETHFMEGLLLHTEGDWKGSIRHLKQAVALNPNAFKPRLELGKVLQMMGQAEQAAKAWVAARQNIRTLRDWNEMQEVRQALTS